MSMKNKIRRAYDLGKPNVLDRVLEDCPDADNPTVIKKKKRLSDRTAEFIATAASIALLLGAVWGGAIYFRNIYGGGGPLSGGEIHLTTVPGEQSSGNDPLPTVDLVTTEPDSITISPLQARDIALGMWGHNIADIRYLKVSNSAGLYEVYYECGKYAYNFHISMADGSVVYDAGAVETGWQTEEPAGVIGWAKARDIALAACGRMAEDLIGFSWDLHSGDPEVYNLELYFVDDGFTFTINSHTGEFGDLGTNVIMGPGKAMDVALEHAGYTKSEVIDLCYKLDDRQTNSSRYWVYFRADGMSYEICVNAQSAEIEAVNTTELSVPQPPDGNIRSDGAVRWALDYIRLTEEAVTELTCEYNGSDRYTVRFTYASESYEIVVHAFGGGILEVKRSGHDITTDLILTAEEEMEIIQAFIDIYDVDISEVLADVLSVRCYGEFNGAYVVFVDGYFMYEEAFTYETVAGIQFIYSSSQTMTVYYDGGFYTLQEAYDRGLLTVYDLLEINNNFNNLNN